MILYKILKVYRTGFKNVKNMITDRVNQNSAKETKTKKSTVKFLKKMYSIQLIFFSYAKKYIVYILCL